MLLFPLFHVSGLVSTLCSTRSHVASLQVGLVGSTHYVNSLSQTEVEKIRMNLNFDMLASPNYIYMIFDGKRFVFHGPVQREN